LAVAGKSSIRFWDCLCVQYDLAKLFFVMNMRISFKILTLAPMSLFRKDRNRVYTDWSFVLCLSE